MTLGLPWSPEEIKRLHKMFVQYYLTRLGGFIQPSEKQTLADKKSLLESHRLKELELWFLHRAVEENLEKTERNRAELTSKITLYSYIAALVLLVLEAVFIFWPGHIISSRYYVRSKRQHKKMLGLMRDLGKRNQEIIGALNASIWSGSWFVSMKLFGWMRIMEFRYEAHAG